MTERPILFQGAMVRALLAGTKTQTRRVVKRPAPEGKHGWHPTPTGFQFLPGGLDRPERPYGVTGDHLYVREAFSYQHGQGLADRGEIWYWADGRIPTHGDWTKPKPSIHMPRWASRITLEITAVRVERLQDISEEDSKAEGVRSINITLDTSGFDGGVCGGGAISAREAYREVWQAINGPGSWEANPWVWVVEFKRVTP